MSNGTDVEAIIRHDKELHDRINRLRAALMDIVEESAGEIDTTTREGQSLAYIHDWSRGALEGNEG